MPRVSRLTKKVKDIKIKILKVNQGKNVEDKETTLKDTNEQSPHKH